MNDLLYLFAGFVIAWMVVFAYLWSVIRKTREVGRRLESAERLLAEGSSPEGSPEATGDTGADPE